MLLLSGGAPARHLNRQTEKGLALSTATGATYLLLLLDQSDSFASDCSLMIDAVHRFGGVLPMITSAGLIFRNEKCELQSGSEWKAECGKMTARKKDSKQ